MSLPEASVTDRWRGLRDLAFEVVLAVATLTSWRLLHERSQGSAERRARAMLFIPLWGLMIGVMLALIDRSLAGGTTTVSRSATVVGAAILASGGMLPLGLARSVEALRSGGRPSWTGLTEIGPSGIVVAIVFIASEVYVLASIAHSPARGRALVIAMMLSRWAIVPIGYGLKPLDRSGLGLPWHGGLTFREFAGSSVIALGIAMGLYQLAAIMAIVVLAITILTLRLLFSRRLSGVSGYGLAAGAAVCELAALSVVAVLSV